MRCCFLVLSLPLLARAIKVPVKYENDSAEAASANTDSTQQNIPIFYASDEAKVDSYLVPPDPHKPEELPQEVKDAPATYLLPPPPDQQTDFYIPAESDTQTDWYPITHVLPAQIPIKDIPQRSLNYKKQRVPINLADDPNIPTIPILVENHRGPKQLQSERNTYPLPSRQLLPPLEDSTPIEFIVTAPINEQQLPIAERNQKFKLLPPSTELQLPLLQTNQNFNTQLIDVPVNFQLPSPEPTLALHLTPPRPIPSPYKTPTKLFPKKYSGFNPIPIPISQFSGDILKVVPIAKPLKPFKPAVNNEGEYYIPHDDKALYQYEKAEQQRRLKEEEEARKQQEIDVSEEQLYEESEERVPVLEQEASATNFRHPGRNSYPAPLRQAPPPATQAGPAVPPAGERTEFRMHGMKGPHSYQFGYDTGKGKNRQFRFEERDNEGRVRGHYGYMEKNGKLRIVNYNADPEHGFHAEAPVDKE